MPQKSISNKMRPILDSAIEQVQWSVCSSIDKQKIDEQVFAIQTTRIAPNKEVSQLTTSDLSTYGGFNLGLHVGDSAKQVISNRQFLQSLIPHRTSHQLTQSVPIQWFDQVHGNHVEIVEQYSTQKIIADAAITTSKNIGLAIMTADCLPILLASKGGDEIAAIHGGWRPLSANIIQNTVEKMKTPAAELYAWLGPCISQLVFEVGQEVRDRFIEQNERFSSAFISTGDGKYLADLHLIASLQLETIGIINISSLSECTYDNPDKYYSYRKKAVTGRMATLICLL